MLPRLNSTAPESPLGAGFEAKPALTSKLQAPTETLPGDHGERFTDEFERASARSAGDVADGRRSSRRAESEQRATRDERSRASEARETRREERKERPSDAGDENTSTGPQRPTERQAYMTEARRRITLNGVPREGWAGDGSAKDAGDAAPETGSANGDTGGVGQAGLAGMAGSFASAGSTAPIAPTSQAAAAQTSVQATAHSAASRPASAQPSAQAPQPNDPKAQPTTGTAHTSPADALGELLTQREEALEREASVLRQLRAHLAPGRREISMQLNPAELGRMHLRLAVRGGRLTAHLQAESPDALAAIERQLPELSASLEAQGFEVQGFELELADTGLSGDGGQRSEASPGAPSPAIPGLLASAIGESPRATRSTQPETTADGGLDLLV